MGTQLLVLADLLRAEAKVTAGEGAWGESGRAREARWLLKERGREIRKEGRKERDKERKKERRRREGNSLGDKGE